MLIAENERWRIRCRTDRGDEDYALTMAEGRFTFYLHGRAEKIALVKTLQKAVREAERTGEYLFFIAFGGYFGIWVSLDDIKFILAHLPMSEAEKQIAILQEQEYDISTSTITKH